MSGIFGIIAKPLTQLLCKDAPFEWIEVHTAAFQSLKQALSIAPCLALPDFTVPFHIETDACATGICAVLTQNGHPLAYVSKALGVKISASQLMKRNTWLSSWK